MILALTFLYIDNWQMCQNRDNNVFATEKPFIEISNRNIAKEVLKYKTSSKIRSTTSIWKLLANNKNVLTI